MANYELVILDVMLPEQNGFGILRALRRHSPVPVILLTARGDDVDRIVGLEIGADDYLPKPFNSRELTARIHAVLCRIQPREQSALPRVAVGDVTLDPATRTVTRNDAAIDLTTVEFDLLHMLLAAAGRVVTRDDISERVLGRAFDPFDRSIDVHIGKVRRKLGDRRTAMAASRRCAESGTSMRSLAIKIFLSFWIAQVVILVGLEIFRPRPSIAAPPLRLPGSSPFFIPTPVLVAAIVVSAIVCFLLARNLAAPLRRVREASERLASGDLLARAGSMVRPRHDENRRSRAGLRRNGRAAESARLVTEAASVRHLA